MVSPTFTFVTPRVPQLEDDCLEPPQGALALAAAIDHAGYQAKIVDLATVPLGAELASLNEATCFGFSTYTLTYPSSRTLAREVRKRYPRSLLVAGGPHASSLPELVAQDFDIVVAGEADEFIVDIAEQVNGGIVPLSGIYRPSPPSRLDALPIPDPDQYVDFSKYHRLVDCQPAVSLCASRGCRNRCAFCNSRVSARGRARFRSADSVEREIRLHLSRGRNSFRFNDDSFTADGQRLRSLADRLSRLNVTLRVFARADHLAVPGCVESLKRAGCVHVAVGVESLSDRTLSRMRKGEDAAKILRGLERAKRAGLRVRIYLIVGFPGETDEDLFESETRLLTAPFDEFCAYNFCPYPGTEVFCHPGQFGVRDIDFRWHEYLQIGRNKCSAGPVMRMVDPAAQRMVERTDEIRRKLIDRLLTAGYCWAGDAKQER